MESTIEHPHRRMACQVETSDGPVDATITGDPNMTPEFAAAIFKMMQLAYEALKRGDFDR